MRQKRNQLILILLPALGALVISAVWLITSARAWHAHQVEQLIKNGHLVSRQLLMETLEKSRHLDKTVIPGTHLHAPALLAAGLHRESDSVESVNNKILADALESAKLALSREPADAFAWAQLAYFTYTLNGPSADALNALRMSIYISPYKYNLIFWRLEMAALNADFWDDRMADLIRRQILIAWKENPELFVEIAKPYGLLPFAREVISDDPEQSVLFENLINGKESP